MTALVLELVEGPTLADRIAQSPIPIDEALSIAGTDGIESPITVILNWKPRPAN